MVMRFRTTDPGRWGTGTGVDFPADWIDENFWDLVERVLYLEGLAPAAAGIDYFQIVGDQLTVVMDDYTTRGPYTLPVVGIDFRGDWEPSTAYAVNEIFQYGGSVYVVLKAHTSALTFDPGAQSGGEDHYGLAFTVDGVLPSGGAEGQWLRKAAGGDFIVEWVNAPIPEGGTVGQALLKLSGTDFDYDWADLVFNLSDAADVEVGDPEEGSILRWRDGEYAKEQDSVPLTNASTTLTLSATQLGRLNLMTAAGGCTITVDPEASWDADTLFAGQTYHFRQSGAGGLTFDEGAGVTINGIDGFMNATDLQGAVATLVYGGSNEWYLFGVLAPAP